MTERPVPTQITRPVPTSHTTTIPPTAGDRPAWLGPPPRQSPPTPDPNLLAKQGNDFLRRIHFWVRLWSVLTLIGMALTVLITVGGAILASQVNDNYGRVSYCLQYPSSTLCD